MKGLTPLQTTLLWEGVIILPIPFKLPLKHHIVVR